MVYTSKPSIVDRSFAYHLVRIVARLRRLDSSCLQSGDSRLGNVWEEYKIQVQLERSIFFSFYNDTIRRIVEEVVDSMHPKTLAALWRLTPEAEQSGASNATEHGTLLAEAIADELCRRIQRIAADDFLPNGFHGTTQ